MARDREALPLAARRSEASAHAPPRAGSAQAPVQALQRVIGNRATSRLLQRLDAGDLWDLAKGPIFGTGPALRSVFDAAVAASRARSRPFDVPNWYVDALRDYANSGEPRAAEDGDILWQAFVRSPRYHVGGFVPSDADAITLDRDVFCDGEPTVDTYIHELVHVKQYGDVGPIRFILSLPGSTAANILVKLARGDKIDSDIMKNSLQEQEAYALEHRFWKWRLGSKYPISGEFPPKRR